MSSSPEQHGEAARLPRERRGDGDPDLPRSRLRSTGGTPITQLRRLSDLTKAGAVTAEHLMTTAAMTVQADATLAQAARIMARRRVKRRPVVDDQGVLEGIVSRSDLLKVFLREDDDIAEEIRRDVVALLFPDPVEPVRVGVRDGIVTLTGHIGDTALVPVAVRLVRAVEGVVDVDCALRDPRRHPDLDGSRPGSPGR